jgi:hypothetical protein
MGAGAAADVSDAGAEGSMYCFHFVIYNTKMHNG